MCWHARAGTAPDRGSSPPPPGVACWAPLACSTWNIGLHLDAWQGRMATQCLWALGATAMGESPPVDGAWCKGSPRCAGRPARMSFSKVSCPRTGTPDASDEPIRNHCQQPALHRARGAPSTAWAYPDPRWKRLRQNLAARGHVYPWPRSIVPYTQQCEANQARTGSYASHWTRKPLRGRGGSGGF
jgi:hypothetical protein